MKREKASSLVLLLSEIAITLFVAGIVAPSLLRSDSATKEALAAGSLHIVNIAGMVFSYTLQNIEFAILGGLAGALAAVAIHFPVYAPKSTTPRITLPATALRH